MKKLENILIVDAEDSIRGVLFNKLSGEGYKCLLATNVEQARDAMRKSTVGLVILDMKMLGKSGIDLLLEIKAAYPETQVLMDTAITDIDIAVRCIKYGAYDYRTKANPLNFEEVALSVRALEKTRLELENREYQHHLEDMVFGQAEKIRLSFLNAIAALASALEAKDKYTGGHSQRVAEISATIANAMDLFQETNEKVKLAGMVHDVGKIGISESILNKQGRLTNEEFHHIQKHPEVGQHILTPIAGDDEEIIRMVRSHHERYDGSGYPDGLKRDEIPLGSRIIAVADAYEAMTSVRPYRKAISDEAALIEIQCGEGTQFDPNVAETFLRYFENRPLVPPLIPPRREK